MKADMGDAFGYLRVPRMPQPLLGQGNVANPPALSSARLRLAFLVSGDGEDWHAGQSWPSAAILHRLHTRCCRSLKSKNGN